MLAPLPALISDGKFSFFRKLGSRIMVNGSSSVISFVYKLVYHSFVPPMIFSP